MDFLEKYNLNLNKVVKAFFIFILATIAIAIAFAVLGSIKDSVFRSTNSLSSYKGASPASEASFDGASLSLRNVQNYYEDDYASGMDAEDYELSTYNARIETRKLDNDCDAIFSLKQREDVIFENSNKQDTYCYFSFKVAKDSSEEILAFLREFKPRELNENIDTIKKQIEDYSSREEILKNKLSTIEKTYTDAINAYDEISALAKQSKDPSSLATVIESKVRIIERLSTEKLNVSTELDQISRAKAKQLDKLAYSFFNVSVYENKFVDGDMIKDSWKSAIKEFVRNMNDLAQSVTLGVINFMAYVLLVFVYVLVVVLVGKGLFKMVVKIWKK